MFQKYLLVFLVSMVPMIELWGAVLLAAGLGLPMLPLLHCLHTGQHAACALHSSVRSKSLNLGGK